MSRSLRTLAFLAAGLGLSCAPAVAPTPTVSRSSQGAAVPAATSVPKGEASSGRFKLLLKDVVPDTRKSALPAPAGWTNYTARFYVENSGQQYVLAQFPRIIAAVITEDGHSYPAESPSEWNDWNLFQSFTKEQNQYPLVLPPGVRVRMAGEGPLNAEGPARSRPWFTVNYAIPSTLRAKYMEIQTLGRFDLTVPSEPVFPFVEGDGTDAKALPVTVEVPGRGVITVAPSYLVPNKGFGLSGESRVVPMSFRSTVATGNVDVKLRTTLLLSSGDLLVGRNPPSSLGSYRPTGLYNVGPLQEVKIETYFPSSADATGKRWVILDGLTAGLYQDP